MRAEATISELMNIAATAGLHEDSIELGWKPKDGNSNTELRMLKDGRASLTLRFELPAERVEELLFVLRDPNRIPGTIGNLIDDTLGRI